MPNKEEEAIEDTLSAVALVRLAMDKELPIDEVTDRLDIIIGDRDHLATADLAFTVAGLAGAILTNWHAMATKMTPPEQQQHLQSPNDLLDGIVQLLLSLEGKLPDEFKPGDDD